jgi:Flp pilus assembly protein TadG
VFNRRIVSGTKPGRGGAAVEYALILPALLIFILGLMDCGRLLWTYTTLAHSVEAASRCAVVNTSTCSSIATIQSYAASQAWGLGLGSSAFTVTAATCGTQVVGALSFKFVIPWFYGAAPFGSSNAMPVSVMACYPT